MWWYVGNVVETISDDGLGVVTTMDYAQNIHSDSQFLKDYLDQRPDDAAPEIMIADGAYGGQENVQRAEDKGVELVVTALTGKDPDTIMGEFQFNEDGTKVLRCPMGHEPEKSTFFGYLPSKLFFMLKTGASNLIAFFGFQRRQRVNYAQFA